MFASNHIPFVVVMVVVVDAVVEEKREGCTHIQHIHVLRAAELVVVQVPGLHQ